MIRVKHQVRIGISRIKAFSLAFFVCIENGIKISHIGRRQGIIAIQFHFFAGNFMLADEEIVIKIRFHAWPVLDGCRFFVGSESYGLSLGTDNDKIF